MADTGKHTPGPWTTEGHGVKAANGETETLRSGRVISRRVAFCHDADGAVPREQVTANANLIAAAPELLAALEGLVAQHDRPHGFNDSNWYARVLEPAREALAKARGEGQQ